MNHTRVAPALCALLVALAASASTPTFANDPLDTAAISAALGRSGTLVPGDVYRVGLPRTDLHVAIDGLTLRPGFALGGYAVYKAEPQGTLLLGDLPLLPAEVRAVQQGLESSGFRITALHNHLLDESPHVVYMHYLKVGDAIAMSGELERALALTAMPKPAQAPATAIPASAPMAASQFAGRDVIEGILGRTGAVAGGVLSIGAPRAEAITLDGMSIPPSMGVATAMNFEPAREGEVATTGDFVLVASEVPLVEAVLKNHGFLATALHQHMLGDSPTLYYMHFYAVGTPKAIATGLKDALARVNLKA